MCNSDYASKQLNKIQIRMRDAAIEAGRSASQISLVGAAKQQKTSLVRHFLDAGLKHIGENYLQEGVTRRSELESAEITWHYIGAIQSNKTQQIAQHFDWVHGVDRLKIAQRLSAQRFSTERIAEQRLNTQSVLPSAESTEAESTHPESIENAAPPHRDTLGKLNVLLQINIDNEDSKSGVVASDVSDIAPQVAQLDHLNLRGFMLLPKSRTNTKEQRKPFAQARELLERINQRHGLTMDSLSMGMSNDLEAAILEGSTMIRIGTDLFGARSS